MQGKGNEQFKKLHALFITYALIRPDIHFILTNPPKPKMQSLPSGETKVCQYISTKKKKKCMLITVFLFVQKKKKWKIVISELIGNFVAQNLKFTKFDTNDNIGGNEISDKTAPPFTLEMFLPDTKAGIIPITRSKLFLVKKKK